MTISIRDVQTGKFFVSRWMVREITADLSKQVKYRTYLLKTGEPDGTLPGLCSKRAITRWAEREATPEEIARMQIVEAEQAEERLAGEFVEYLRQHGSDVP